MQLVRSCPLKDISYVAGRVYAILENHPDAAWQKIDPSFAFDPARMISATDLPYENPSMYKASSSNKSQVCRCAGNAWPDGSGITRDVSQVRLASPDVTYFINAKRARSEVGNCRFAALASNDSPGRDAAR